MIRALLSEVRELAAGRRRLYRISGPSMLPSLADGDLVWIDTTTAWPRVGDVVVVRDPTAAQRLLVKRVRSLAPASFAVGSDAPADGRDSRHFGSLRREHLVGRVVADLRSKATKTS